MNNKAHLRPQDYDSNGDIIPMACKEEKSDLISREALKKEVKKLNEMLPNLRDEKDKQSVRFAINILQDIIDNAPTVERVINMYPKGEVIVQNTRPQGEWILNKDENPECPFCHHSFTYWGNFCGNCGAKMLKGGAK